jgi:hypothetical protein
MPPNFTKDWNSSMTTQLGFDVERCGEPVIDGTQHTYRNIVLSPAGPHAPLLRPGIEVGATFTAHHQETEAEVTAALVEVGGAAAAADARQHS